MTDKPPDAANSDEGRATPDPMTEMGASIAWNTDPDRCICGSVFPGHNCTMREQR